MSNEPLFKMRFVGFKEDGSGELKPTSPGGFKRHEIRMLPFEYSLSIWWEIVGDIPDLVLAEPKYEDSVFVKDTFVPPEDSEPETGELEKTEEETPEEEIEPDTGWPHEPTADSGTEEEVMESPPIEGVTSTQFEGEMITVKVEQEPAFDQDGPIVTEVLYDTMTVKSLKFFIKKRGGEVDSNWKKPDLIREARKIEESSRTA